VSEVGERCTSNLRATFLVTFNGKQPLFPILYYCSHVICPIQSKVWAERFLRRYRMVRQSSFLWLSWLGLSVKDWLKCRILVVWFVVRCGFCNVFGDNSKIIFSGYTMINFEELCFDHLINCAGLEKRIVLNHFLDNCWSASLSVVSMRRFWYGYLTYVIDESTEKFRLT